MPFPITKLNNTEAGKVQHSEFVKKVIDNPLVLWEEVDDDYQGDAEILFVSELLTGPGMFGHIRWVWGSCEGCDNWLDEGEDVAVEEIRNDILWFSDEFELQAWIDRLKANNDPKGWPMEESLKKFLTGDYGNESKGL